MQAVNRALLFCSMVLGGCAGVPAPLVQTTDYVCAQGGFSLHTRGDAAEITINGMHFALIDIVRQDDTTVYRCSMLTLTRRGDLADVEMEGQPYLGQCRPRR